MVSFLQRPKVDSVDLIEKVVEQRQGGKHKTFFNNIKASWKQRVKDYDAAGGSPASVPTWAEADAKAGVFKNLYASKVEEQVQVPLLHEMRRKHRLTHCPACGEPGRPNTLDHYLPKDTYPHLSITPLNLFPMCDACQEKKGVKTGCNTFPKWFIHPYYDKFIEKQIIFLEMEPPFNTPSFNISFHNNLSKLDSELLATHVRELEIVQRFGHFFDEQHIRLLKNVQEMRDDGEDVETNIRAFKRLEAHKGPNSWDHIYYSGVLDNPALMAHLIAGPLPAFI